MDVEYNQLTSTFGSKLKADEVIYLLAGLKPVLRQLFFEHELELVEWFCKNNKIYLTKSNFKIVLVDSDKSFSNKGERAEMSDPREGTYVLYLSLNEKQSLMAALAEQQIDDKLLGELLGYPTCCINYFLNQFGSQNPDPVLQETGDVVGSDSWMLDISHRKDDLALISHFPCSWCCEDSLRIARNRLHLLEEINNVRFKELFVLMPNK